MPVDLALMPTVASALVATLALALPVWALSVVLRDVSIVDITWGLLVLTPVAVTVALHPPGGPRTALVLALCAIWALRLGVYIAWRHRGQPEDRRYQAIRARNEPHFALKSLYLVFGLQAVLACVVATPLAAAAVSTAAWKPLDTLATALFVFGVVYETVADWQLARFKADPQRTGQVMDDGLWRYSRHPNYFGECCVWWGAWLFALAAGAAWTIVSPLLITWLLLKVSGVALMEKDIGHHRPGYRDYIRRTSAFLPRPPKD